MNEQKQFIQRVQQFTNNVAYGKSLLDLSDKKQTENKKILTLMIELNETEKIKELGQKSTDYVMSEFSMKDTIDQWDQTLWDMCEKWEKDKSLVYKFVRQKTLGLQ